MTVNELRKALEGVDGEMQVLIPTSPKFDGCFLAPCPSETGVSGLGLYDEEETKEAELLNKPTE